MKQHEHSLSVSRGQTPESECEALPDQTAESDNSPTDSTSLPERPRSTAERWGLLVIAACRAERDLKTLQDWASFVGTSYTSLAELCRLVHMRPTDARDLTRVLRVMIQAPTHGYNLECLLDVSDRRTLRALLRRAGLSDWSAARHTSPSEFLRSQRFVDGNNPAIRLLKSFVSACFDRPRHDECSSRP